MIHEKPAILTELPQMTEIYGKYTFDKLSLYTIFGIINISGIVEIAFLGDSIQL